MPPQGKSPKRPSRSPEAQLKAAGFSRIAGVDEAGRGPWAGPVIAAAVILKRKTLPVRIDDSKRLSARKRVEAFFVICRFAEVGIGVVSAEEIDRENILRASLYAMRRAVEDLGVLPDHVLVDGHLAPPINIPCTPLIQGDKRSYVIACASIVAKVYRDALMGFYASLDARYGFEMHKGYGTPLHRERLNEHGPSLFHRRSFRPVYAGTDETKPEPAS